jgi:predicted acetyltransferase
MSIEIRCPAEDEFRDAALAVSVAFGDELRDDDLERERKVMPLDRFLAAYDDGKPVGAAASYPFEVTIPGGTIPAAGVTWVGVLPSHRRRGVLRDMMRRQLREPGSGSEPIAVLYASESAIYGRFGYAIAAPNVRLDARADRFRLRGDPDPVGTVRLVERDEALELFPPVFDTKRLETPGMFARTSEWWRRRKLAGPEPWRLGPGPKYLAVFEIDGAAEGYAIYRIKSDWERGIPQGQVRVVDLAATSPVATREVWRFLFGIDLVSKVDHIMFDPGSPLFLMVEDARRLHLGVSDGLWLRLVDVEAALAARSYATHDTVVIDLRDEFCPWNEGRWKIGAEVARTTDAAELSMDVTDLASAYLGAFDFHRLADAQRAEELKPGALARATALFATTRPPYCPEEF